MPIISGESGGSGGLPTGWAQSGSPADVTTNGGHLTSYSGSGPQAPSFNLTPDVLSLFSDGVAIQVATSTQNVFVAQAASVGEVIIGEAVNAAPPDLDLSAGQVALWFDKTDGAAKFMLKGKTANGTVVTAAVALS